MNSKTRWIAVSLLVSIALMIVKFFAFYLTNSNAILSDALESIINVVASGVAFYSIYLSSLPRDPNHPYGHGKIEYFSSGFEGTLIFLSGLFIVYESIVRFFDPKPIHQLQMGTILIAITAIINGVLGFLLVREGKKSNSEALTADGKHLLTDTFSSFIILVGFLFIYITGFQQIDTMASVVLSIFIFYHGYQLMRRAAGALLDEQDPELMQKILNILNQHKKPEWIDVHNLRIQKYGADLHIDCHLTLPFYWPLTQVHTYVNDFEQKIIQNTGGNTEIFIHTDPCLPQCCRYCKMENCDERASDFEKDVVWTTENLALNQKHAVAT